MLSVGRSNDGPFDGAAPDATAQIARTVAMGMMGERLPLRIAPRSFATNASMPAATGKFFKSARNSSGDGVTGDAEC